MRSLSALGIALSIAAAAQAERPRLFPRLHARLHPQPCAPAAPCYPRVIGETKPEPKAEAPARKYDYVTLTGSVLWPGAKAIPPVELVNARPGPFPGFGPVPLNNLLIDPTTRGVKNVIVWLRPDDLDRSKTFPRDKIHPDSAAQRRAPETHVIRVKDGNFEPRILAARAGDQLRFLNTAPVPININYSSDLEQFNANLPLAGDKSLKNPLEPQRAVITFACNVHAWLQGRIRVFDHPYFALTDEHGNFEIPDVPVGRWRIVYQHELGYHNGKDGFLGFPFEVKNDQSTLVLDPIRYQFPEPK